MSGLSASSFKVGIYALSQNETWAVILQPILISMRSRNKNDGESQQGVKRIHLMWASVHHEQLDCAEEGGMSDPVMPIGQGRGDYWKSKGRRDS